MLYDTIKNHSLYPFHMPGHKRQRITPDLPYELDMTEIEGFDYLHSPSSCIKDIEDTAKKLYGSKRAFMLINGATCGIMSAIGALTTRGDRVLLARNCHVSVYRAVKLFGLKPEYVLPVHIKENGEEYPIFGSVTPEQIEQKLSDHPDIKLVIITSPTYEGVCSDIKAISKICKAHDTGLFVDEAHGAHFPFSTFFPDSALSCGADVTVTSLHKTLPALTQTALLLTNDLNICGSLQKMLAVFQTSSPSYVLMSSVETCLDYVQNNSFDNYTAQLRAFQADMKRLNKLRLLLREGTENIFAYDKGKLVISTAHTNISGTELANILRREHGIETELSTDDYIIAMTSVCDTEQGFILLKNALLSIDKGLTYDEDYKPNLIKNLPKKVYEPYETGFSEPDIAKDEVFIYPPGIPIYVTGELLKSNTLLDKTPRV